ncbi:MAG TPA: IPT/TIG domain-containing protein [Oscillatoriaceae cyanobacterium]
MRVYRLIVLGALCGTLCLSCVSSPSSAPPSTVTRHGTTTTGTGDTGATASPSSDESPTPTASPTGASGTATPSPTPTASSTAAPFFAEVLGTDSNPAAGATVHAYNVDGTAAGPDMTTDAKGQFALDASITAPVTLEAVSGSNAALQLAVAPTTKGLKLQLAATGLISGHVSVNGTSDLSGVTVKVDGTPFSAVTSQAGTFTISDVPAGTYNLTASSSTLGAGSTTGVAVTSGNTSDAGGIALSKTAPVVSGFSPANGAVGAQVTITGSGFGTDANAVKVSFASTTATPTSVTNTTIKVSVPSNATDGKISVSVGSGSSGVSQGTFQVLLGVQIEPQTSTLQMGSPTQFTAVGTDVDGTTSIDDPIVTWSATGGAFTVDNTGTVTPNASGHVGDQGTLTITSGSVTNSLTLSLVNGVTVSTYAGDATSAIKDAVGKAAEFARPVGLAYANGKLFVADANYGAGNGPAGGDTYSGTQGHLIRAIDLNDATVSTVAGAASAATSIGSVGASASISQGQAAFNIPYAVAATLDGKTLFVADRDNNMIRKVDLVANKITNFASAYQPAGVAVDSQGNVYVAEWGTTGYNAQMPVYDGVNGHDVICYGPSGSKLWSVGGGAGDNTSHFQRPTGLAIDNQGDVYVADMDNQRICEINTQHTMSVLAGGQIGTLDGTGTAAQFNAPAGLAYDTTNNVLYVADSDNFAVRRVTLPAAQVTTIAGNGYGNADGAGSAAKFGQPFGIAVDGFDNIFVTDKSFDTIREIKGE